MDGNKELQSLLLQTKSGKQLSEYHIKLLKKQNINTPHEFVTAEHLHKFLALGVDKIEQIKRELLSLLVCSVKLKTLYQRKPLNYSTGILELDTLLDSIGQPFRPGRVWELYGETGVGKTELLHTLAVNFVCQNKQQVLFIDSKHDFNNEHIYEILQDRQLDCETTERCMNAINVVDATTAQCLIATLEELHKTLTNHVGSHETESRIKLVLVDSLAACFMLFRSSHERNEGRRFLTQLAMIVRKLATQHGIAFVLGNLSFSTDKESAGVDDDNDDWLTQTGSETQEDCTLLGEYWLSVCTLRLALELPEESNSDGMRMLKVLHNNYGVSGGSCLLRITDAGVI